MAVVKLPKPSRGRGALGTLVLAGGLLGFVSFLLLSACVTVEPDEFAVRQVYLGPNKGVQTALYGPGTHVVIPGYERMHVLPRDMQVLDLNNERTASHLTMEDRRTASAIKIQTSEGYQVTVDISVIYRVVDPFKIITEVGAGDIYETTIVARRADKILRQTLGELNAEDFYSDMVRTEQAEHARRLLAEDLGQWGIQVWAVLIRDYNYDDRYQQAIEDRKIQDQKVFKNQAEAVASRREAEKNRVLAEGKATIDVELERGRSEVRMLAADADLYFRQRVAEGDKLVALAEAEGTRLENDALQQAGASNMVGLEMAKAMGGTELIMVSTTGPGAINPLDLDALLEGW